MHMLHIDGRIKPGKKAEFLETWSREILPSTKMQGGFIDEFLLFFEEGEAGIDLTFWDSQKEAEEFQHNVFEKVNHNAERLLEGKFTVHGCGCDLDCYRRFGLNRAA